MPNDLAVCPNWRPDHRSPYGHALNQFVSAFTAFERPIMQWHDSYMKFVERLHLGALMPGNRADRNTQVNIIRTHGHQFNRDLCMHSPQGWSDKL